MVEMTNICTTSYHTTSNGQTGRLNRTIIFMIQKAASEEEDDWDGQLPNRLMYYPSAVHSSTGYSQCCLMFGFFRYNFFIIAPNII